MHFTPESFDAMLNGFGQCFGWRRAYACPCINPHSGSPRPNCPQCAGKGRVWSAPVSCSAAVGSRGQLKKYSTFGAWDDGDMLLAVPSDSPLYEAGQYDRLEALNRTEPFSMNLVSGLNDALRFSVVSVDRVFWLSGGDLVEGAVPSVEDGALVWAAGTAPPAGATYSITGRRRPEYFVYLDLPLDRPVHHGARMPRRLVVRRFDLLGR